MRNNENTFRTYLIEIGKYPLLSAEEERKLAYEYRDGNIEARQKLITSNLRLVVNIAKNYRNQHLSIGDLVSEGTLGLVAAVEKYNPDLGYRFSTCATPWIKQAISKAITDKGRNIRIPAHIYQLLGRYRAAISDLELEKKVITDEDIARRLNIEVEKVPELRKIKYDTISIETPLGTDGKETIGSLVPDTYNESTTDKVERSELHDKIMSVLHELKPRDREIVKLRYGLAEPGDKYEYGEEHTLEEIGDLLGITRERVRQIEKQALSELRLALERA